MKQIYGLFTALLVTTFSLPLQPAQARPLEEAFRSLPDCTGGALTKEQSDVLKTYVQKFHASRNGVKTTPFETLLDHGAAVVSVATLRQGHDDVLIYLISKDFCASGGCGMLILNQISSHPEKPENRYRVVGHVASAHLPIQVLPSEHYKWPDLGFGNADTGREQGYAERLEFSGRHYPSTTTQVPRYEKKKLAAGRELIGRDISDFSHLCRLK